MRWRAGRQASRLADCLVLPALRILRYANPDRMAKLAGGTMRVIGPLLREHRIGRQNLVAAFPDKSPQEIERILRGVWDNLGRVGVEFVFLDQLWDAVESRSGEGGRIEFSPDTVERYRALQDDGRPALIFAAHLGNWELPAMAAKAYGLEAATLFKPPSMPGVAEAISKIRSDNMGILIPASLDAPVKMARLLENNVHVGMLVDQHFIGGVDVTFFNRPCKANPVLARLARHFDCPIHGVRTIRLPGQRFRLELSEAIEAPHDPADGRIDVALTMQRITDVVEAWVREHPDQWLWLHRRWRD